MLRKKTSAPAESCIQLLWSVVPTSMTALTWMVEDIPNRTTTEDFTEEIDEAGCVRQNNFFHLLLGVAPFFQLCDHGGIFTTLGRDVGLSPDEDRLR